MADLIEQNLLLLLDPYGERDRSTWRFVPWSDCEQCSGRKLQGMENCSGSVFCFDRHQLLDYLLFPWRIKKSGVKVRLRKFLYIDDGNLSSIFATDAKKAYPAFAEGLLPRPRGIRQWLRRLMPVELQAERKYVVTNNDSGTSLESNGEGAQFLAQQNYLFFSNVGGKLLLTTAETLCSGRGMLYKSTTNDIYAEVMEKEYRVMQRLAAEESSDCFPRAGSRLQLRRRTFFSEEYIKGCSLRTMLHAVSSTQGVVGVCALLDRLDAWFSLFAATFRGERQSLSTCYAHLIEPFSERYGADRHGCEVLQHACRIFDVLDGSGIGLATGIAHNDLWPGNFVVAHDRLVAVDWERATENRGPVFDYFWMLISAVLEHYVSCMERSDYSRAMRQFLAGADDVARHAERQIKTYMERIGFDRALYRQFMLIFMMEWAIQGYLVLGRPTDMDMLAYGELVNCLETGYFTGIGNA